MAVTQVLLVIGGAIALAPLGVRQKLARQAKGMCQQAIKDRLFGDLKWVVYLRRTLLDRFFNSQVE